MMEMDVDGVVYIWQIMNMCLLPLGSTPVDACTRPALFWNISEVRLSGD